VPVNAINSFIIHKRIIEGYYLFIEETTQPFGCTKPDILIIVFKNGIHAVIAESVTGTVINKAKAVKTAHSPAIGGEPHIAVMILNEIDDLRLRQAVTDRIILKIEKLSICGYAKAKKAEGYVNLSIVHK
jgi:hypothetical protein